MVADKVDESHKVGYYRLCTLSLDKLYNVVVCGRGVFYKYLTDNSDTGLFNIKCGDRIKVGNDSLYILIERASDRLFISPFSFSFHFSYILFVAPFSAS